MKIKHKIYGSLAFGIWSLGRFSLKIEVYLSLLLCLTVTESFKCVSGTSLKIFHRAGISIFSHNVNQSLPATLVLQLLLEIFNKTTSFLCLQT